MLEFFDSIKQDLQDAPSEVKQSFNNLIQYFDTKMLNGSDKDLDKILKNGIIVYWYSGISVDNLKAIVIKDGQRADVMYWECRREFSTDKVLKDINNLKEDYKVPVYDLRNLKFSLFSNKWFIREKNDSDPKYRFEIPDSKKLEQKEIEMLLKKSI